MRSVYDAAGELTEHVDANGAEQRWDYDERGHIIAQTDKTGATATIGYDVAGYHTSETERSGAVLEYSWVRLNLDDGHAAALASQWFSPSA